ncbi:hypothetical protein BX616_005857 [Lobosporangium transversale]|nr:hypothetical protein BX616_005857 [Lobosporangium transversale]
MTFILDSDPDDVASTCEPNTKHTVVTTIKIPAAVTAQPHRLNKRKSESIADTEISTTIDTKARSIPTFLTSGSSATLITVQRIETNYDTKHSVMPFPLKQQLRRSLQNSDISSEQEFAYLPQLQVMESYNNATSSPMICNTMSDKDLMEVAAGLDPAIVEEDAVAHRIRELFSAEESQKRYIQSPDMHHENKLKFLSDLMTTETQGQRLGPKQCQAHEQRLAVARAEKKVNRPIVTNPTLRSQVPQCPTLPNEILIQVLEQLIDDQPSLLSAAFVSVDWNLCATNLLYRYPSFASTLHWAFFIQTLCRNKDAKRPRTTRRRRSIIRSFSAGEEFSSHPPLQLIALQAEVNGGQPQQTQSRLNYNLGDFVRGIDLSRKIVQVDQVQCSCNKPEQPGFTASSSGSCSDSSLGSSESSSGGSSNSNINGNRNNNIKRCPVHPQQKQSLEGRITGDPLQPTHPMDINTSRVDQGTSLFVGDGLSEGSAQTCTRDRWLSNPENAYSVALSNRQRHSSDSLGSSNASYPAFMPLNRHTNLATSQRWSILWSMEHQYRQLMAQNPYTSSIGFSPLLTDISANNSVSKGARRQNTVQIPLMTQQNEGGQGNSTISSGSKSEGKSESVEVRYKKPITITASSLIQMARHCPNLEFLCLGSALMPDTLYLETGDYQSTLQPGPRTGLTYVNVTAMDGAKALGEYCPKLSKLLLAGCEWVTLDEVRYFAMFCRQLQTLDLRHCGKLDGRLGQLFVVENNHEANADSNAESGSFKTAPSVTSNTFLGVPSVSSSPSSANTRPSLLSSRSMRLSDEAIARVLSSPITFPDLAAVKESNTVTDSPPVMNLLSIKTTSDSNSFRRVQDGAMFDLVNAASHGRLVVAALMPRPQPATQQPLQADPTLEAQEQQEGDEDREFVAAIEGESQTEATEIFPW